jgi:hypothetical protein
VHRAVALTRKPESIVALAAFGLAALTAAWMIRPIHVGMLGYDAAASVLYFQRLVAGTTLEAFTGATPKALLTGVYGLAYSLVPDWRVISWLAIAAYAGGIAGSAVLAYRLSGVAAAAFAAVGLVGSALLLQDVDLAYAVSWALLCWAIAGLLVTALRPRFAWAGIVLAVGGLARYETLILVGVAGLALLGGAAFARAQGRPLTSLRAIGNHYAAEPILIVLALLGLGALLLRSRWEIAGALVALALGVMAFIVFLAIRRIYISDRYIAPADLALTFAAAIGLGSLRVRDVGAVLRGRLPRHGLVLVAAIVGSLAALAVVRPFGPLDRATRSAITTNATVHRDIALVIPDLRSALAGMSGVTGRPTDGSPTTAMGARSVVLAPVLTVPQLAVELGLPLSSISGTVGASITTDGTYPRPGQVVFHQVDRDTPAAPFALFEVDRPTAVGRITLDPLLVDPARRFWLVRIGP